MRLNQKLVIHKGWVTTLATSPDQLFLASGSTDTTLKFIKKDTLLLTLTGHQLPVNDLLFSTSHPHIHSCSRSLITHDLTKNCIIKEYTGHSSTINSISENGDNLVATAAECVNVYDMRSKRCLWSVGKDVTVVRWMDGCLVFGSKDGGIRIYNKGFLYAHVGHVRAVKNILIVKDEDLISMIKSNKTEENKTENGNNFIEKADSVKDDNFITNHTNSDMSSEDILQKIFQDKPFKDHSIVSLSSTRLLINKYTACIFNKATDMTIHNNQYYLSCVDGQIYRLNSKLKLDYECKGGWVTKAVSYDNKLVTGGDAIQYFY